MFEWLFGRSKKQIERDARERVAIQQQLDAARGAASARQRVVIPPKPKHVQEHEDSFTTSLAVGAATDNAMLGALAGGNWAGGLLGAAMAESSRSSGDDSFSGGGGVSAGGGASASWSDSGSSSSDSSSSYSDSSSSSCDSSSSSCDTSSSGGADF